jgi:hypothetical protein
MALFGSYAPPGVYTSVIISGGGQPLFGSARIPVIIGEGQQSFTQNNVELFRGSSAVADPQAVNENLSDQVTGTTNTFTTTYFPVVNSGGTGTVTTDPTQIQVTVDGVPATVISLNGTTGSFVLQDIPALGSNLVATYYFLRGDTLISNENLAPQIPVFASLTVSGASSSSIILGTTLPGAVGNEVSLQLVSTGPGVTDSLAVSGYGTNTIVINILKTDSTTRTVVDLHNLVEAGILTLSAGYLTATTPVGTGALSTLSTTHLTGGAGPNSNTQFQVHNLPIVDGTNGGVVTTSPAKVTVKVNGVAVAVSAVDGAAGLVTLVNPVPSTTSTFTITYFTNTYQNTYDLLPASNVASIVEVGLGPNRADFIQDVDYVLGTDSNGNPILNWGASTSTTVGTSNSADTTPFGPADIVTTLVDEHVYLQFAGTGNGNTAVFTLPDVPTDGSGLDNPTDNPNLIQVYVGTNPYLAYQAGAVKVARVNGASAQVTLYNIPSAGSYVYASYYRNTLNDHSYTLSVVNAAQSGQGTYTIANELGYILPVVANSTNTVAASNFATTGIVYPHAFSDAWDEPNAPNETITLTFNNDGSTTTPGVQASLITQGITFTATTTGTSGNSVTIAFTSVGSADSAAITGGGTNALTVDITTSGSATRTTAQIVALFGTYPPTTTGGGIITATGGSSSNAAIASLLHLAGGINPTSVPYTHSYAVTSSLGSSGSHGTGYLDQTYIDATTGFKVTIVNPADALGFGYTQLPSPQYAFAPADTLTFTTSQSTVRYTGSTYVPFGPAQPNNLIAIPGLTTSVVTTFGASTGDTAIVNTYNKSGSGPTVGEFYYVTFTVAKTAADMALQLFDNEADAYTVYGQPSVVNRLSLGVQFLVGNGANVFGCIQVPQQPGLNTASDADFISAIQSLTTNLPGYTKKADVIVPLSTSPTVHQFLSRQLITQATARYKGEGIGFVGYSQYTTSTQAITNAQGLANGRMIAIGNPVAGVQITNSQTGIAQEYAVSGEFMAAALAGLNVNPANDVATSLTLQDLVGFSRLLIRYDDATMNLMASQGLVMLTDNSGALSIRHYKSTDPSNPITSEPTCTTITDYVRQQFRGDLKQFIGRKLVSSLVNDITAVCNARLRSLVSNEIINGYKNLSVVPDPNDPTTVDVTVTFMPMFSLLYISVTFTVTTTL